MAKNDKNNDFNFLKFLIELAEAATFDHLAKKWETEHGKEKINPYTAAGIAFGSGDLDSAEDTLELGGLLGGVGAFDPDEDTSWHESVPDGSEYGLYPEDFPDEYEYICALEDATYAWRENCEDGSKYGIDPDDYETEIAYKSALYKAKYGWRITCEDGEAFGIDPEDYETEDEYAEALREAKYGWRITCEDGEEFGVDPDDYENEDDYNDALYEAKYGWRQDCDDGDAFGADPYEYETLAAYDEALSDKRKKYVDAIFRTHTEQVDGDKAEALKRSDFPNKRRYYAVRTYANASFICSNAALRTKLKARCEFIFEKAETLIAANYLTADGDFLYAQAVKDNLSVPVSLPDEDGLRALCFADVIREVAKSDVALSFDVWEWCLVQFLPYGRYSENAPRELTTDVMDSLYRFPDGYSTELVRYMDKNPYFMQKFTDTNREFFDTFPKMAADAVKDSLFQTAYGLFSHALRNAGKDGRFVTFLAEETISLLTNYDEVESLEYFRDALLPLVKASDVSSVKEKIAGWEKEINEHIDYVVDTSEKYECSRKNAWRKRVTGGQKYCMDPRHYDTEEEYLKALDERKYGWRKWYENTDTYGLKTEDFETEKAFYDSLCLRQAADEAKRAEEARKLLEEAARKRKAANAENRRREAERRAADEAEGVICYTYYSVAFPYSEQIYSYRAFDDVFEVGDEVVVPTGDRECVGKIVSVGAYGADNVPYPVGKTRFIIRKADKKEDKSEA